MVSDIPKKLYKWLLGLIALSLSLTSVFATLSTVSIFSSPDNIHAGSITETTPGNYTIPVVINNTGFYPIETVNMNIRLFLYNSTYYHLLMDQSFDLGNFPAQAITASPPVAFSNTTFTLPPPGELNPSNTKLNATITIDLYYIFGLMHMTAEYNQPLNLGEFLSWVVGVDLFFFGDSSILGMYT